MPELANRDEYERLLASRLARVNGQHRRELIELLGDPPDIGRIDAAFWTRASAELQAVIAPILEDVAIAAAEQLIAGLPIGVDWGLVNQDVIEWISTYSIQLSNQVTDTTQRAVRRALSDFFNTSGMTREELEAALRNLEDRLGRIFGPNRAEMIAITEVTRAAAEAQIQVSDRIRAQGIEMVEFWITSRDELVCPVCQPLDRVERKDGYFESADGRVRVDKPPAHVRCRCDLGSRLPEV